MILFKDVQSLKQDALVLITVPGILTDVISVFPRNTVFAIVVTEYSNPLFITFSEITTSVVLLSNPVTPTVYEPYTSSVTV